MGIFYCVILSSIAWLCRENQHLIVEEGCVLQLWHESLQLSEEAGCKILFRMVEIVQSRSSEHINESLKC